MRSSKMVTTSSAASASLYSKLTSTVVQAEQDLFYLATILLTFKWVTLSYQMDYINEISFGYCQESLKGVRVTDVDLVECAKTTTMMGFVVALGLFAGFLLLFGGQNILLKLAIYEKNPTKMFIWTILQSVELLFYLNCILYALAAQPKHQLNIFLVGLVISVYRTAVICIVGGYAKELSGYVANGRIIVEIEHVYIGEKYAKNGGAAVSKA